MVQDRCRRLGLSIATIAALALVANGARADEVVGRVKSVDASAKKVVITEKSTDKDREITIDSGTSWTKEKKGKVAKKFDLAKLKVGSEVEVTSEKALASKVVIKAGKKKKAKDA